MPVTRVSGLPLPAPAGPFWPTSVSPDGRSILDQSSNPWLMLSDQLLPGIHNASGLADFITVFTDRQARGYNGIWICLVTDAYIGANDTVTDWAGNAAFNTTDLSQPNSAYWTNVDSVITTAAQYGITCIITPIETAGNAMGRARTAGSAGCNSFGQFLGNRYKNNPNIIWLHGNDFGVTSSWISGPPGNTNINGGVYQATPTPSDATLMFNIAAGIKTAGDTHLQSAELNYNLSLCFDNSVGNTVNDSSGGGWRAVLDLNQAYTYFETYDIMYKGFKGINSNDALSQAQRYTPKPVFLGESNYEGADNVGSQAHPATAYTLRLQNYWTVLAGGLGGQIWGNKPLHHFSAGWQSNLNTPGAQDAGRWATFFRSYSNWNKLVPDSGNTFLTGGFGTYDGTTGVPADLVTTRSAAGTSSYAAAAVTADGSLGIVYTPVNQGLVINMAKMTHSGTVTARWFDPTNAAYTSIGTFANSGSHTFTPSATNSAGATDWLLVLTA